MKNVSTQTVAYWHRKSKSHKFILSYVFEKQDKLYCRQLNYLHDELVKNMNGEWSSRLVEENI
jgi:hypothetical protein